MSECGICGAAVLDGYLCHDPRGSYRTCTVRLEEALGDVQALQDELRTTIAKQDTLRRRGNDGAMAPKNEPAALPLRLDASEVAADLQRTLNRWAYKAARLRGSAHLVSYAAGDLAGYLLWHTGWLRLQPDAPVAYAEIMAAVETARHTIDLPPDPARTVYVGPCGHLEPTSDGPVECTAQLWAEAGQEWITCRTCGTEWNVAVRRTGALFAARDQRASATAISRALTSHDIPVTPDRIRQWRVRGRIRPAGVGKTGSPVYRVGDVLDLVETELRKEAR